MAKTEKENSNKPAKTVKPSENILDRKLISEKDIAMDFAINVQRKFSSMIKSIVLFGSQAKDTATSSSDIDIIIIIDDASIRWDAELVAWYREELSKMISSQNYSSELHINTVRLTTWWQDLLYGDPVVINILRYGEVMLDSGGFFQPLKVLLLDGKIKSTPEAVHVALQRAPTHLLRSRLSEMNAIEGVYWAMVDSAQAALMTAGKLPPSPEHIPKMLNETFAESGMLKPGYVKSIKELYALHKAITYGEVKNIRGDEIDRWQDVAEKFMLEMTSIIDKILDSKK